MKKFFFNSRFLAMAKLKQVWLCSFGLTKTFFSFLWHHLFGRLKSRFTSLMPAAKRTQRSVKQQSVAQQQSATSASAQTSPLQERPRKAAQPRPANSDNSITPTRIRQIVESRWHLRYNELDNNIELRPADQPQVPFLPLDERSHNSLVMAVQDELPLCYRSWIDCFLFSSSVEAYHPLRHYLAQLPAWDGHDRVAEVAAQVSPDPQWEWVFHRWMRAMVAAWLHEGAPVQAFHNQLAPLLVSERQGLGKSTFCRTLLPPELRRYYTDKFDLTADSHAERRLATLALINMDEFDRYTERQMGTLKNLMQLTQVVMRRPHGRSSFIQPRVASFIGTSNFEALLTDPSGSRRFYCQVVDHYIGAVGADYSQLYAQLLAEVRAGQPVAFTKAEEAAIEGHNALFYRESPLEEVFAKYFSLPADPGAAGVEWLSASDIFDFLKRRAPRPLQGINALRMSKLLRRLGVPHSHTRRGNLYAVVRVEPDA